MKELILGVGLHRRYTFGPKGKTEFVNPTTVDIDPSSKPDVLHDLNIMPYPFKANTFNEIYIMQVLEHLGTQGDYKFFFDQFNELNRIIKKNGRIFGSVPAEHGVWAWAEPGHTRVITQNTLQFLDPDFYKPENVQSTQYLSLIEHGGWKLEWCNANEVELYFVLRTKKI
jgi:hypothetical protein